MNKNNFDVCLNFSKHWLDMSRETLKIFTALALETLEESMSKHIEYS